MKLLIENWRQYLTEGGRMTHDPAWYGTATDTPMGEIWTSTEVDFQLDTDLEELGADYIKDMIDLDAKLFQLADNSNSNQQYIQKIKEYLNSIADEIGWSQLGDEVLAARGGEETK